MSARRKSIHSPAATAAAAPAPRDSTEAIAGPSSRPDLEDTRAKWVQDRQEELDRVFDRHDTLVRMTTVILCIPTLMSFPYCVQIREAFHLEKFVTLLSYDPKVSLSFPNRPRFVSPPQSGCGEVRGECRYGGLPNAWFCSQEGQWNAARMKNAAS